MPDSKSFTLSHEDLTSVLSTDAYVMAAFNPQTEKLSQEASKYTAIWDTGATGTVITQKVVDECNLKPMGMAQSETANGIMETQIYLIAVVLPHAVGFYRVRVTRGNLPKSVDMLIGMDIIVQGDFVITNVGRKTVFSFRVPSMEHIDFVEESKGIKRLPYYGIAKNDACPCGNRRKFKNCHGSIK